MRDQKKYDAAIAKYNEAIKIKPEVYPKDEIGKIERAKAAEAKKAAVEESYKASMAAADKAFAAKNWPVAKANYLEAQKIKPAEALPKTQLIAIQKALDVENAEKDKENQFNAAVAEADAAFSSKNYPKATSAYTRALGIKQDAAHPKNRLAEIKKIQADEDAAKKKEGEYNTILADAKKSFDLKLWEEAKKKYQSALDLKPGEAIPVSQIGIIDDEIKKAKALAEKNKAYDEAIASGDAAFKNKNWAEAKIKYKVAGGLKPSENYPKEQLLAIDDAEKKETAASAKEEKYEQLVESGDNLYSQTKYPEAIGQYEKASEIKPEETYPKQKIEASKEEIKKKTDASDKEEKINSLFKEGQVLMDGKSYDEAKAKYNAILAIDDTKQLARVKIDEIGRLIEKAEKQKTLKIDFQRLVDEGDVLFKANDWSAAQEKSCGCTFKN